MIKTVSFQHLNEKKYKNCVENSAQKSIFCELDFLKAINGENWNFLIFNDYEAVMPVPFVYKFGQKIVTRPWGMQQCGVFSEKDSPVLNQRFYDYLEENYTVNYFPFNVKNSLENNELLLRNLSIPRNDYELVKKKYTSDRRRNVRIRPEISERISLKKNVDLAKIKEFYFQHILGIENGKKNQFWNTFQRLNNYKYLNIWTLYFDNNIASVAVLVENPEEVYTFSLINDDNFKKYNTPSILIDLILQEKISEKKFSFMGGNIPHIYEFFRRFGAKEENYSVIQRSKVQTIKRRFRNFFKF